MMLHGADDTSMSGAVAMLVFPLRYQRHRADSMGMPAPAQTYYTVDEVLAFPDDGNRYELVYGELLVSPTPRVRHQRVVMRLTRILLEYCDEERVGEVLGSVPT